MTRETERRRIVLLGASNLTMALPTLLATAQAIGEGASRFMTALGHGRSFGTRSTVLLRTLPAILDCGLWEQLHRDEPRPTFALISDIGNDVIYGRDADTVLSWLDECLTRLGRHDARTIMTGLPIQRIEALGPARFRCFQTLMFPTQRITLDRVREVARQIDSGLPSLAQRHGAVLVPQQDGWYGLDPIHIRPRLWAQAYSHILADWVTDQDQPARARHVSLSEHLAIHRMKAQRRWLAGRELFQPQPAGRLAEGSTVWMY